MKHLTFLLFLAGIFTTLCLPEQVRAQHRYRNFTYLGAEIGPKSELYTLKDNGTELYKRQNFASGLSGIYLEQELNRHFSASMGIYFSRYGTDFGFRRDDGRYDFPSMRTYMFPLRLQATIPIFYGIPEIRIKPVAGVAGVVNSSFSRDSVYGKIAPILSDQYSAILRYDFRQFYVLAETGLHLEMLFAKGIIASLGARYMKGFSTVAQSSINYRIDRKSYSGTLRSTGDLFNFSLSIKYPVSRFWQNHSGKK